ncbi:MAG: iron-sulfur cluster assembly accessory protein [Bradyrhizobiaceae bacterium]|nr:iron-sulfur cluster assembly accessory protein [Bradyrhizobiaceae bacterium]
MAVAILGTDALSIPTGITGADEQDNITITKKAIAQVKELRAQNGIPDDHGLRVGVKGGGCSGLSYTLGFDAASNETDLVLDADGIKVLIDSKSMFYLMGVTLDFSDGLMGRGFVFNNPSATKTCGCGSSFGV